MKFTLDQVAAAHATVKTGADFPRYVQDLKALGVAYYDFFLVDGHSVYVDIDGLGEQTTAKYAPLAISPVSNEFALRDSINVHQAGQTDFMTFCQQAADAGVVYWRTDVVNLVCMYVDAVGHTFVSEPIPDAGAY